ncbi:hypothetical protein GCM10027048_36920 [Hymenobacter coalescens]
MKQRFSAPLLGTAGTLLLLLGSACSSDPATEPQPAPALPPAPAYALNRSFHYPASTMTSAISYAPAELRGSGLLRENLSLEFTQDGNAQQDMLFFTIEAGQLRPGLTHAYTLQSTSVPGGTAQVRYAFTGRAGSTAWGRTYASSFTDLEGTLTISQYDAAQRLISGSYRVLVPDVADPLNSAPVDQGKARCRITVSGSFENLVLR